MALFWKAAAAVLLAVMLGLTVGRQEKDIALMLTLAVCCMICFIAVFYLEPVLDLLWEWVELGGLDDEILRSLLKAVGIALVAQTAGQICSDAGNASMARTMQMLGSAAILYLCVPLFQAFMNFIREILGQL